MAPKTNSIKQSPLKDRKKVRWISITLSILFHAALILIIQKAFPLNWTIKPLRTYHVEFIRPPVDKLSEYDDKGGNQVRVKSAGEKGNVKEAETISLDTTDKRYSSYAAVIKQLLMEKWKYPRKAWENLIEGQVLILFSLNSQGKLIDVKILDSSSHGMLDENALNSIKKAAPFPPFPGSVTVSRLNIKANFAYKLTPGS